MSTLQDRLREHAAMHDSLASTGDPEQAAWAKDLRKAADLLARADSGRQFAVWTVELPLETAQAWSDAWDERERIQGVDIDAIHRRAAAGSA